MADNIVEDYLQRHSDQLDTRRVVIDRGAAGQCYETLDEALPQGKWLVAADQRTAEAAGESVCEMLDAAGRDWVRFEVEAQPQFDDPTCTDEMVNACQARMMEKGCSAGIAVGSGTINDTVKLAAHNLDRPMAVVGTAPSMNGYTSGIAAVLSDGVKTTNPCTAPRVVVADVDVMAEAPMRMICSGLGDLMSKPVSNSDWTISAHLNDTPLSLEAMEIIEEGAQALEGIAPKLPDRDRRAVRGLIESLMLSGIAMSVAGTSSPASGGEHLISHYIDMTAYAFDKPHDFHGCQVGVGTLTSAFLYEKLQSFDPTSVDVDARVAALPSWEAYADTLRDRFGPLFDAVVEHAEPGYPTPDELRTRLETLIENWDDIFEEAGETLRTHASLEEELAAARCPTRYDHLDVDRDRARRAILHSKDIRNRYTVLHLCWELGVLEEWGEAALDELYD